MLTSERHSRRPQLRPEDDRLGRRIPRSEHRFGCRARQRSRRWALYRREVQVVALSEQLYFELGRAGHPIGVSVLCPGFVNTNIFDSGRNRQTDYGDSDIGATPEGEQRRAALNAMRSTMIQPAEIGELVFEAIRTRSLYIIPTGSEAIENAVRARLENVVERRNPGLNFSIL
ncbi:hypothetical protein [Candidatus Amarobacter glycogenicus]|uniref:hypothetical protein n=1 Tax=Candidatus Amarobacter glycogenicus TaxID=3140699 RepID=UPI002A106FF6|nr:hypothetical protein [Dehalococcoidia bacterium]